MIDTYKLQVYNYTHRGGYRIQLRGGDRIQDEGGKFCTILRFCTIYQMNLQENIEKKIFVPPLSHSGGGHFCCPPPELLRRGTILRGGTVPPLKLLRGGQSPIPPPCIRSCIYIYMYNAYKKYTKHIRQSVWNKRWISNENYIPLQSLQCENGDVCWLGQDVVYV